MPPRCTANLLTFAPVVSVHFECRELNEGWSVLTRHRHYGTTLHECESDVYVGLTQGEALDVIDTVLWTLSAGNADTR